MLNFTDTGEATGLPTLLIVHGLFGSARNWGAIAKRLEAFTEDQRRAIYQGALSYLRNSSFGTEEEELDLSPLLAILKGRGNEPELPSWATTTRGRIQELIRKQLEDLPALLEQLEPKDRVAALTRLLPYTMNRGEGDSPTVTKL